MTNTTTTADFRALRRKVRKQRKRLDKLNIKLNALRVALDDQMRTIHARLNNPSDNER